MHSETDDSNHSKPILLAGRCNRLFGLTIAGDFPFTIQLLPSDGPVALSFSVSSRPLLSPERLTCPPIYTSSLRGNDGVSLGCLYREPEGEIFRFPGAGDFRIG